VFDQKTKGGISIDFYCDSREEGEYKLTAYFFSPCRKARENRILFCLFKWSLVKNTNLIKQALTTRYLIFHRIVIKTLKKIENI